MIFNNLACEKGYSWSSEEQMCKICPYGTYSKTTTAESCTECSGYLTTLNEGSSSDSQCGKYTILNLKHLKYRQQLQLPLL